MENTRFEALLEKHLHGGLSPTEQAELNSILEKDPLLKQEMEFQEEVMEGIKRTRRAELKARLRNIDVVAPEQPTGFWSNGFQYAAAGFVAAGLVLVGAYMFDDNRKADENSGSQTTMSQPAQPEAQVQTPAQAYGTQPEAAPAQPEASTPAAQPAAAEATASTAASATKPSAQASAPASNGNSSASRRNGSSINVQEPMAGMDDASDVKPIAKQDVDMGSTGALNANRSTKLADFEIVNDAAERFHYTYNNNKLFLYGDFSSQLCELLELNTNHGRQLYLYYSGSYYGIKADTRAKTELQPLTEKQTIADLEQMRRKK